jgi:hypothetical protein
MKKLVLALLLAGLFGCTQEAQNQLGRSIQNWTGTNGVLEVFAGDRLVHRFIKIDKLSTAYGTATARPGATALATASPTRIWTARPGPGRRRSISRSRSLRRTCSTSSRRQGEFVVTR